MGLCTHAQFSLFILFRSFFVVFQCFSMFFCLRKKWKMVSMVSIEQLLLNCCDSSHIECRRTNEWIVDISFNETRFSHTLIAYDDDLEGWKFTVLSVLVHDFVVGCCLWKKMMVLVGIVLGFLSLFEIGGVRLGTSRGFPLLFGLAEAELILRHSDRWATCIKCQISVWSG